MNQVIFFPANGQRDYTLLPADKPLEQILLLLRGKLGQVIEISMKIINTALIFRSSSNWYTTCIINNVVISLTLEGIGVQSFNQILVIIAYSYGIINEALKYTLGHGNSKNLQLLFRHSYVQNNLFLFIHQIINLAVHIKEALAPIHSVKFTIGSYKVEICKAPFRLLLMNKGSDGVLIVFT